MSLGWMNKFAREWRKVISGPHLGVTRTIAALPVLLISLPHSSPRSLRSISPSHPVRFQFDFDSLLHAVIVAVPGLRCTQIPLSRLHLPGCLLMPTLRCQPVPMNLLSSAVSFLMTLP